MKTKREVSESKKILLDELRKHVKKNYKNLKVTATMSGIYSGNVGTMLNKYFGMSIDNLIQYCDALGLKLVIEDKDAEWGPDMARLRMMPKKLYLGERIEARSIVKERGFFPRIDLFDSVETALKFMPKPCDIYEIRVEKLVRKHFEVLDHPFGTMYSYHDWISPESIVSMVTHR